MRDQESARAFSVGRVVNSPLDAGVAEEDGSEVDDITSPSASVAFRNWLVFFVIGIVFALAILVAFAFGTKPFEDITPATNLPGAFEGLTLVDMNNTRVVLDAADRVAREQRLQNGPIKRLFHQTTEEACRGIMSTGFRPGKGGIAGPGMYFAEKPVHTAFKAEHWGCMIEAEVRLGTTMQLPFRGDRSVNGEKLLQQGYDSVWMPRGWPVGTMPEWVVYFPDQITTLQSYSCTRLGQMRR